MFKKSLCPIRKNIRKAPLDRIWSRQFDSSVTMCFKNPILQNAAACRGVLAHARGLTKKGDDGKKFIPLLTSRISGLNNILLTN